MKKIISLFLVLVMCCGLMQVSAETAGKEATNAGYLKGYDIDFIFGTSSVNVMINDVKYTLESEVNIDGISHNVSTYLYNDVVEIIKTETLVRYALNENGKISMIKHAGEKSSCTTRYDETTQEFSRVEANGLPIMYYDGNEYYSDFLYPVLSDDYVYTVDVYADCCAVITDFISKTNDYVIKNIDVEQSLEYDFSGIWLYFKVESDALNQNLVIELSNGVETETLNCEYTDEYYARIKLPNEDVIYTAKFWIEDDNENKLTDISEISISIEKRTINFGFIQAIDFEYVFGVCLMKVEMNGVLYTFCDEVKINGTLQTISAHSENELIGLVELNSVVKFALDGDGRVDVLNFTNEKVTYITTYSTVTNKFSCSEADGLPIMYYNGQKYLKDFMYPVLSDDYSYTIDVYADYCVVITDFISKEKDYTITDVSIEQYIDSNFTDLYLHFTINSDVANQNLVIELSNETKSEILNAAFDEEVYEAKTKVLNANSTYTAKIWIEDDNQNKLTDEIQISFEVKEKDVKKGVVSGLEFESRFGRLILTARVKGSDSTILDYTFSDVSRVNDLWKSIFEMSEDDILELIKVDTLATFTLNEEDKIDTISLADVYTLTEHNITNESHIFTVKSYGISAGDTIIFAEYKNNRLVSMVHREYSGVDEIFTTTNDIDRVALMVWSDMEKIIPITDKEEIDLSE